MLPVIFPTLYALPSSSHQTNEEIPSKTFHQEEHSPRKTYQDGKVQLQLELARTLSWSKRYSEAIEEYKKFLEKNPLHFPALKELSRVLYWSKNYEQAIIYYRGVLAEEPTNHTFRKELASMLMNLKRFKEAADEYRVLVSAHPGDRALQIQWADALTWAGRTEEAYSVYQKLIKEQPESRELLLKTSENLIISKRWKEAAVVLQKLLTLYPEQAVRKRLSEVFIAAENHEEAIKLLEEILEEYPENLDVQRSLAQVLTWAGRYEEALNIYQLLLEKNPHDLTLREKRAQVLLWAEYYDQAQEEYKLLLSKEPEKVELMGGLAESYLWNDRLEDSWIIVNRLLQKDPSSEEGLLLKAQLLMKERKTSQALSLFEDLLADDPDNDSILLGIARTLSQSHHFTKANTFFMDIITSKPDSCMARIAYGNSLIEEENFTLAKEQFNFILKKSPGNTGALLGLARLFNACLMPYNALSLCETILKRNAANMVDLLVYVESLSGAGEYTRAQKLVREFLHVYPYHIKGHLIRAHILMESGRYDEALLYLENLPEEISEREEVLMEKAKFLYLQHLYQKSIKLCDQIIKNNPENRDALLLLLENLIKEGDYAFAQQKAQEMIKENKGNWEAFLLLGKACEKQGLLEKALQCYQRVLHYKPHEPNSLFRLSAPEEQPPTTSEKTEAQQDISRAFLMVKQADFLRDEGLMSKSLLLLQKAYDFNPQSAPIQLRLSEALASLSFFNKARQILASILSSHPANEKAHLFIARTYALEKKYDHALREYYSLSSNYPDNSVYIKEKARVYYWAHYYAQSFEEYEKTENLPSSLQKKFSLEKEAKKQFWHKRYFAAINFYDELLSLEPGNSEALFDLGQIYCTLGECKKTVSHYQNLLSIMPNHYSGQKVLDGILRESSPQINTFYLFKEEDGRGDLKNLQVQKVGAHLTIPHCSTRNQWSIGYAHSFYKTHLRREEEAASLMFQWRFQPSLKTWGRVFIDLNHFRGHLKDTETFGGDFFYRIGDRPTLGLGFFREDILDNRYNFDHHIFCDNVWWSIQSPLSPRSSLGIKYTLGEYSDGNHKSQVDAFLSYRVSLPPKEFKVSTNLYYIEASHKTRYLYDDEGHLINIRHPYWTPEDHWEFFMVLQWKHYPWGGNYCGYQKFYYDIQYHGGVDRDHFGIHSFRGELYWDISSDWRLTAYGLWHFSHPYDSEGAGVSLVYLF